MHMLSTILASIALFVACGALIYATASVRYLAKKNARSISLAKIAHLESEYTALLDSVTVLQTSIRKMVSRDTMRQRRDKSNGLAYENGEPTNPEEWYTWARKTYLNKQKGN